MKGATTDPWLSIIKVPNKAKTKIIGNNLSIKNSKNSFKKLMCYN